AQRVNLPSPNSLWMELLLREVRFLSSRKLSLLLAVSSRSAGPIRSHIDPSSTKATSNYTSTTRLRTLKLVGPHLSNLTKTPTALSPTLFQSGKPRKALTKSYFSN
ncbi:hypothetical protein E4U57_006962, partial [Claviceps arundinis]